VLLGTNAPKDCGHSYLHKIASLDGEALKFQAAVHQKVQRGRATPPRLQRARMQQETHPAGQSITECEEAQY
jgi:hypothetical protein